MINLKAWSLRSKIILHLLAIGGLAALLLTLIYIRTQRNIIHTVSRQKAELVGSMIENSIYSFMKEGEVEKVQSTLESISASKSIKKIRIIDTRGNILRSSEAAEVGRSVDRALLGKIDGFLSSKDHSPANYLMPGFSSVGIRQVENKRECYGCHAPQTKINGLLVVDVDYAFAAGLLRASQVKGILIAILSLTLLIIIVLRLFEKLINRPIDQLRRKMKEVQEGNLNFQFLPLNNDEIGTLGKSFNIMVARLREANQKIEELYEKQMEKAEHLASIGELTAGLAHEIKNPIAGVKGALEIIHHKTDASDPQREIFAEVIFQIDRIHKIIQDLLSYSRPKDMDVSLVSPNECIQNAIKLARTQMNGKNIEFHFAGLKENVLAAIDTNKIQELILNLMLNSISAIDNEGTIEIRLQQGNKRELEIILADDGNGIKPEIAPQIFNPFFTTKPRGTGLGLSICKKIIEVHRGSVEVKSKSGEGTTFIIRLPVLQPSD